MEAEELILEAIRKMESITSRKPKQIEFSPETLKEIQSKVNVKLSDHGTIFGIPVAVKEDIEPGCFVLRSTEEEPK